MYLSILDISNIMKDIHSPLEIATSNYWQMQNNKENTEKIISFRQYDTENEKLLEKHLALMLSLSPGKKENALSMFTTQHPEEVRNLH